MNEPTQSASGRTWIAERAARLARRATRAVPLWLSAACTAGVLAAAPAMAQAPARDTHTVRPGETLWDISQQHLNNPLRWTEFQRDNVLPIPERLQPGQRLTLPLRQPLLRVAELTGQAWVKRAGQPQQALASGMPLQAGDVLAVAEREGATPYDIPGVEFSHVDEYCSFDAFLSKYSLDEPALQRLAAIVRGADTSRLDLTPQSAGLFAISLGLSARYEDDHEMLAHGMILYDALYAWCRSCQTEQHNWPPTMA